LQAGCVVGTGERGLDVRRGAYAHGALRRDDPGVGGRHRSPSRWSTYWWSPTIRRASGRLFLLCLVGFTILGLSRTGR